MAGYKGISTKIMKDGSKAIMFRWIKAQFLYHLFSHKFY